MRRCIINCCIPASCIPILSRPSRLCQNANFGVRKAPPSFPSLSVIPAKAGIQGSGRGPHAPFPHSTPPGFPLSRERRLRGPLPLSDGDLTHPARACIAAIQYRTLSKRIIDRLSVDDKNTVFWDRDLPGFGIRVYPSGAKVYVSRPAHSAAPSGTAKRKGARILAPAVPAVSRRLSANSGGSRNLHLRGSAIRRRHRNHLSAALAAVERMLALRETYKGIFSWVQRLL